MNKTIKILLSLLMLTTIIFSVNVQSSEAASKPTKKELQALQKTLRNTPVVYGKKKIYFSNLTVSLYNGRIDIGDYNIPDKNLKLMDTQHGKKNKKPLLTWTNKAIPKIKKLANKYKYGWNIEIINNCDSYEPKTFKNSDVMGSTGSCGYSFPIISVWKNENITIFYTYEYKQPKK